MNERILIVDDLPSHLRTAEEMARYRLDYHTVATQRGKEALYDRLMLPSQRPDVVVLDLAMPLEQKMSVIREMKRCAPDLPLIMLVRYGDDMTALRAIEAGADDFLSKPVTLARFSVTVTNLLKQRAPNRQVVALHDGGIAGASHGVLSYLDINGKIRKLRDIEEEAIAAAVRHVNGCMTQAARCLGIGRSTLYRKINELNGNVYMAREAQTMRPMMTASALERS